jgi:hypothetical protein
VQIFISKLKPVKDNKGLIKRFKLIRLPLFNACQAIVESDIRYGETAYGSITPAQIRKTGITIKSTNYYYYHWKKQVSITNPKNRSKYFIQHFGVQNNPQLLYVVERNTCFPYKTNWKQESPRARATFNGQLQFRNFSESTKLTKWMC